ncbi:secretin N-terminal domain-containing protein [Verrucomicrobiaceae bacterium 227]
MKRTLTFLLGLSVGALAQEPPAPGSVPKPPGVPAPVPAIQPAAAPGVAPVAPRPIGPPDPNAIKYPEGDGITEPNLTGLFAAQLYEDVTGKRVIMSSAISQAEVFFVQRGPLTNKEVADLLTKSLLGDGLAFIPDPLDPDIVRLAASGPITGTTAIPKEYINDEFDLPTNDQLVTYRMIFKFLKPEDALKIFQTALGQLSASGNITAVPNASSLMITENSNLIRQMIKIQKDIDVATSIAERWVEVTYGDVDEISERMNEIYNEQAQNQTTRTARANTPPAPGSVPGATGGSAGEEVPIKIIGVRRTSRILLVGRPADLVAAEAMVRSFDIPSSGKNRQTFRLRYLRVGDFLPIAQDAISVTLGDSEAGGQGGANSNRNLASQNTNTRNNNTQTTGQAGQTSGGNRASIDEQDIPTAPESALIGNTHLVGDNVANTIIVNGPPHHIELIRDLISDLDTESQQVALSAVVGSYSLNNGLNFGIDLARILQSSGSSFAAGGRTSFGVPSVVDPSSLTSMASLLAANGSAGNGVSLYGLINDDFGIFVNALENTNKFKTLERTVLTTRNNRVAQLSSGQRIAIPSSTFVGNTTGGQNTNVEYRDVTLELMIQPLINDDNKVTLEISLVRDSVGNNRDVGELVVPDINTQQLSTSITVDDGSAVILGGVITETDKDDKRGVPVLSRIPGIGRLFGNTGIEGTRAELVIMIQPRIVKSRAEMDAFRSDYERSSSNTAEVRDAFPERTGVLPPNGSMPTYTETPPKAGLLSNRTPSTPAESASASSSSSMLERLKKSKIRGRPGRHGAR